MKELNVVNEENLNRDKLYTLDVVEVYKLVLKGILKKFPDGFWMRPDALENAAKVTKYLLEGILEWSEEEILKNLSLITFKKYKLRGMIAIVFNDSPFKALDNCYPGKYKPFNLGRPPVSYWTNDENIREALDWLFNDKLGWSEEEVIKNINVKIFYENGLGGLIMKFNSSAYQIINFYYPGKYKPFHLGTVTRNYWNNDENIRKALDWLFNDKLGWSEEEIIMKVNIKIFKENSLESIYRKFNNSVYEVVNFYYPNKYKPFQIGRVPKGYWDDTNNIKEALDFYIDEINSNYTDVLKQDNIFKVFEEKAAWKMRNIFRNDENLRNFIKENCI